MLGHNDARSDMDATAPPAADENDLDAPGLPDRLLRKAETAVLGLTSRILCVVERCTDEHNYSAVLRTAEALGVQHVWLVDPVVREADGEWRIKKRSNWLLDGNPAAPEMLADLHKVRR